MSDKITVEEMVKYLDGLITGEQAVIDDEDWICIPDSEKSIVMLKAIRKHLEKPTVSRERIKDVMRDNYIPWELGDFILLLTELGIEVED